VDEREECDDGNADDGDACLNTCTMARCGDGQVRRVIEECDDGNAVDSDGCSNRCLACGGANSGFVWLENEHCYTVHDGPLNWNAASAACGDLGGHLTTTFNSLELDAVTQGLPGVPTRPIWLGLRRGAGNLFAWVTGEELRNTFWPGQAAPKDGACVTLDRKLNEWAAEDCDSVHAYSCEREAWTAFDGATNAYQVFYQLKSFPEAKAACERRGAHLATVFDKNEHGAVALLTQSSFWIGAEAATVNPKVFSWVTGETVVYENFAFAEPNEDQTNDTCVIIGNDEAWHDRGCGELHAYACEVD
jgi:cysteine-rich repeat protein